MKKNKTDKCDWISLQDEVPVSDMIILVYTSGKVVPARHSHTKFNGVGMQHYFVTWCPDNTTSPISNVTHWMKMPPGPKQTKKEWIPD